MTDSPELSGPSAALVSLVVAMARDLAAHAELLNRLDGLAGDGDLGVTATHAADAIAGRGDVAVGDRRMLDALSPAADAFRISLSEGATIPEGVAAAAAAAEAGAQATTVMEPKVGRAGWLKDRARGNEDPGARLVALAFAAAAARVA